MSNYRTYYNDATKGPYHGSYLDILNEYQTTANQPQALRNKVYTTGNAGLAMSHLMLVRELTQPGSSGPGKIVSYHRATHHDAWMGQTIPFDGVGYSFIGDVSGSQPPMTVILPGDSFNSAGDTQVPTAARINQLLAANETLQLIGPFAARDPDIEAVTVRKIIYVPSKYMLMALDTTLTPREAWNQIRGTIVADNKETECAELVNWLRVSLTRKAPNDQLHTTVEPPVAQTLMDPQHAATFQSYRLNVMHHDLPDLSPSHIGVGAQAISNNIANLVIEQRQTRQDAADR